MIKRIILIVMALSVLFGTLSFAAEAEDKSIERNFHFSKSVSGEEIIYLPVNEGDVDVKYVEGNDILIDVLVSSSNDSTYSKTLLDSFDLKFINERSFGHNKSRIKLMPFLGEKRVFDEDNTSNFWYCMEDGFKWNTYGYDIEKTRIRMNYVISIPKEIKSIRLRNSDGQVKLPNDKFENMDIALFDSTLTAEEINSDNLNISLFDGSKLAITKKVHVNDTCNFDLYSSSCELNSPISSKFLDIELYDKSKMKMDGVVNVDENTNIDLYSSELSMSNRTDINTRVLMLQCFSGSSYTLNGNIKADVSKIENYDSQLSLMGEKIDSDTIKIEGYNGSKTECSSSIDGDSMKITCYGAELHYEGDKTASNSMILEMFSGSKLSMISDFSSVKNVKIEAYNGSNLNIETKDTLKNRVKKEIYSGAKIIIDGVRQ